MPYAGRPHCQRRPTWQRRLGSQLLANPRQAGILAAMHDPGHLIWMDLEMTGLEPDRHVILEIATLITDPDLNVVAEGPESVIRRDAAAMAEMDEWCVRTHTESGLVERVAASRVEIAGAEAETLAFIQAWTAAGVSPLCGNSIHQDRRFLRREMPGVDAHLHYRNIDVSTLKELVGRWYPEAPPPPPKQETHRALDDIRESIAELKWYRENFFVAGN